MTVKNITNLSALSYMGRVFRAERRGNLSAILTTNRLYFRWHASPYSPIKNVVGELSAPLSSFDTKLTPRMSLFKFLHKHCPVWFERMEWHMRNEKKSRTP